MKLRNSLWLLLLAGSSLLAQENLTFQKPSKEILALAEYKERHR